jgi:small nuclear ribonucleoprotein (snRNP)-like protein
LKDYIVVIRLESGEDIVGVLVGENEEVIKLEHPYYITYNTISGSRVVMAHYCPFTDETLFEFKRSKLAFCVTASALITDRYLSLILDIERDELESTHTVNAEDPIEQSYLIEGNDTKH